MRLFGLRKVGKMVILATKTATTIEKWCFLETNNLGVSNDIFSSDKCPKKVFFWPKNSENIENLCFEGNEVRNCKSRITQCKLLVVSPGLRRILWK